LKVSRFQFSLINFKSKWAQIILEKIEVKNEKKNH